MKKHIPALAAIAALALIPSACFDEDNDTSGGGGGRGPTDGVTIGLELPDALEIGTLKPLEELRAKAPHLDPNKSPAPINVPKDSAVVSRAKSVSSSDKSDPFVGTLDMLTDGDKSGYEGYSVILFDGPQWVQVDLGDSVAIDAVVLWHFFLNDRVVNDVIVQISDDPEFKTGVTTLFNNDVDNTSGQGKGNDKAYIGVYLGKQIPGGGKKARYVRTWSNGSTDNTMNEFIEVEVWGRPAE